MSPLFLNPPSGVVARLETVQRNSGAVLALATSIREAEHPSQVWPRSSTGTATGSRVVVHPHPGSWKSAAARAICSDAWDADPDSCRIVGWTNNAVRSLGQALRISRYGAAAAREWQIGELVIAPSGLPCEGQALGQPVAPACSEFRVVELGPVQPLEQLLGTYDWRTPARKFERQLEVSASTVAQRAVLELLGTDEQVDLWLEPPCGAPNPWEDQCKDLRTSIRQHLGGADRKKALAELADLTTLVPEIRQGAVLTVHSSQGSTFRSVFVASDLGRCTGPEASGLAYVAVSRASESVHVLPMWGSLRGSG